MMTTTRAPRIIEETADYVVLDKPSGLLVHPADSSPDEKTLVDWLVERYPEIVGVGDEPEFRPGIVHRLDREASGVLVVARTQQMYDHLKNQFQDRSIHKEYVVLVHGKVAREFGEITLPISRASRGGRMAAHGIGADALEAHTEYFVERRFTNTTLLRVNIHTGRTHQIRVHMFALQHPVVGDSLYPVKKVGKSFVQPERLLLHARKMTFTDLGGNQKSFEAPLADDFESYLGLLKQMPV